MKGPPPKQLDGGAPRTPWQHASVLSSSAQAASQLRHALPGQSQAASQPPRTLKVCVSLASTACMSFLCRHACAAAGLGTCLPSKRSHAGELSRRLWPPFVSPTSRALCPSRQSVHSCPSPDLPPTCECCFPQAFLHTPLETRRRSSHCILTCSDRALDEAHARQPFWSHWRPRQHHIPRRAPRPRPLQWRSRRIPPSSTSLPRARTRIRLLKCRKSSKGPSEARSSS